MKWPKESLLRFKTESIDTIQNSAISDAKMITEVRKASSDSTDGENYILPRVSALLFARGPFYILWLVAFFVVNSLDGKALRFWSHILEKILKLKPSFADRNSPATVIFESSVVWVSTAINHAKPCGVLNGSFPRFIVTVLGRYESYNFISKAATRRSFEPPKAVIKDRFLSSAIAKAQAYSFAVFGGQISDNQKSSKASPDKRRFFRHCNVRSLFCLAVGRWLQPSPGCDNGPIPGFITSPQMGGYLG